MKRKSQTEMMGLVIVVILITLALLFVLSFVVLRKPTELKKQYTQSEIAANTLNALIHTTTICTGGPDCKKIGRLLKNCAENPVTGGTCYCPDDFTSCGYAETVINEIFDKTLTAWNIQFEFTAAVPGATVIHILEGYCKGEKRSQSEFIPTDAGILTAKLDICG